MSKIKNYMMDIEEKVFDIGIAKDAGLEMWNDFWGYY